MATSKGILEEVVSQLIENRAKAQKVSPETLTAMNFRSECMFDPTTFEKVLRVRWQDPERPGFQRGFQTLLSDAVETRYDHNLHAELSMAISNLDIRGELFFFKIHKHFPNRVSNVCHRTDGLLTVKFKNGRELTTSEDKIESTEFLATCGMIYDL